MTPTITESPSYNQSPEPTGLDAELAKIRSDYPDKRGQVIVLIMTCIQSGLTTKLSIVETLKKLGFKRRYVTKVLKSHRYGSNDFLWLRDTEQQYHLTGKPASVPTIDLRRLAIS